MAATTCALLTADDLCMGGVGEAGSEEAGSKECQHKQCKNTQSAAESKLRTCICTG